MKQETGWFRALSEPIRLRLAVLLARRGETCVCELAEAVGEQHFKVSRHLGIMRSAGMVNARREGTWMYYSIVQPETKFEKSIINCLTEAFASDETVKSDLKRIRGRRCPSKLKVLFLCTGNSCRSQMAEGWTKHLKPEVIDAYSAGIEKRGLDPLAVEAMAEEGVDISGHKSKTVFELKQKNFDYVVTLCSDAEKTCPVFPGKAKVVHRGFDDPPRLAEGEKSRESALSHYRRVRDEIKGFVEKMPGNLK